MKGGSRKTRKRKPKKTCGKNVRTDTDLSPATDELNFVAGSDPSPLSQSALSSSPSTPRRGRGQTRRLQEASLTSTPIHTFPNISGSPPRVNEEQLHVTEPITQQKTVERDSPCSNTKVRRSRAAQARQLTQRAPRKQRQANGSTVKCRRGRSQKTETGDLTVDTNTQPSKRKRPRFELEEATTAEEEDSLLSSALSIELSHYEDPMMCSPDNERSEEEEEEEDLPSFLMPVNKKPPSITVGTFAWCKFRSYPSWPVLVKSVNRKQKKASIVFIEDTIIQKKKGFGVNLKSLKPFDCEEAEELIHKAKEVYNAAITWSLELIEDYRIRIACGSFSGSFIEYFNHDMSYPVRRKHPQAPSERPAIASDILMEEPCVDITEESFNEKDEDKDFRGSSKRLLPDRTHAAHNRANEKLVQFIVKQRMVERHLLDVIHGQQQSRWLRSFMSTRRRRRVVNIYLEDDQQLDQVYWYLSELYATAVDTAPCLAELKSMEDVPFVLDVLLPEAIIYAIAGVDNVSVKKAEEKYLRGRCISNRERQEFDLMIEREMRRKSQRRNATNDICPDFITLD